jgi:hypothetical protein
VNQLLEDPSNIHKSKVIAAAQNNEIGNLQLLQSREGQDLLYLVNWLQPFGFVAISTEA